MTRLARAAIDLDALRHNLYRVRQVATGSRITAVVKANAYGHGLLRAVRALQEADGFAVTCSEEVVMLREAGVQHPILLLQGFTDSADLNLVSRLGVEAVVHNRTQVETLEHSRLGRPIAVWLKVDSGMHRLGFSPGRVGEIHQRLVNCSAVAHPIRLMTHLANADDRSDPTTREQVQVFRNVADRLPGESSIANSAGILGWPETHADWVRPGIMLYGVSPFTTGTGPELDLKPVMTLGSRLIAVNRQSKGAPVGYGGAWVCPEDMPVGVVAVGYGDGYPRHAASGTPVLVNGHRVPLIGRVSMDLICVDLRAFPQAKVGDAVVLWGEGLPAEEVARKASTIAYELLCGVTQRVAFFQRNDRSAYCAKDVCAPSRRPV